MPHIQNRDQAEELVRLVRFPPRGDRSVPPHALLGPQREQPALQRSMGTWDDNVAIFCQIEDVIGVQNVEEIAQVDGGMYINKSLMIMTYMMCVFLQLSKHARIYKS